MITEEVHISYNPATSCSTVDDRWTSPGGVQRGRLGIHREPYGWAGVECTAMLYAAAGRLVHLDVVAAAGAQADVVNQVDDVDQAGRGASDGA
ncbi:hypothetical protein [Modestobacter sp. DSM 44400]|uniref:hypothetical protein n=1 Tax=Modestobacter sp. DSM 44400 TaxID=1550230 RepID=UPI000B824346|nr:hypothetical protein [Modestobacter sp. DSM 44400]